MRRSLPRRTFLTWAVASATAHVVSSKAASSSRIHEVRIMKFAFVPDKLEVSRGDTVRWINDDVSPHTATADQAGWDTGALTQGQSAEIKVSANMETSYLCVFHPHMKATLELV